MRTPAAWRTAATFTRAVAVQMRRSRALRGQPPVPPRGVPQHKIEMRRGAAAMQLKEERQQRAPPPLGLGECGGGGS